VRFPILPVGDSATISFLGKLLVKLLLHALWQKYCIDSLVCVRILLYGMDSKLTVYEAEVKISYFMLYSLPPLLKLSCSSRKVRFSDSFKLHSYKENETLELYVARLFFETTPSSPKERVDFATNLHSLLQRTLIYVGYDTESSNIVVGEETETYDKSLWKRFLAATLNKADTHLRLVNEVLLPVYAKSFYFQEKDFRFLSGEEVEWDEQHEWKRYPRSFKCSKCLLNNHLWCKKCEGCFHCSSSVKRCFGSEY